MIIVNIWWAVVALNATSAVVLRHGRHTPLAFASPDVVVIGGGHSGCEAAAASSRVGAKTLLITPREGCIGESDGTIVVSLYAGEMSCNPSIGGIGKGNIVCEIDALDGVMGVAADDGAVMYHLLNSSRGPAVRGPRIQADRDLYRQAVRSRIASQDGLHVLETMVEDVMVEGDSVRGVILSTGECIECKAVVITTGTFLKGVCHRSKTQYVIDDMPK